MVIRSLGFLAGISKYSFLSLLVTLSLGQKLFGLRGTVRCEGTSR